MSDLRNVHFSGRENDKRKGNGKEKPTWRRKWQPTPVFLPGEFHGQRGAWQATVHGVLKESGTTERLTLPQTFLSYSFIGVMEEQDQGTSRFDS